MQLAGNLAARNHWALEAPTGLNFLDQPPTGRPRGAILAQLGPESCLKQAPWVSPEGKTWGLSPARGRPCLAEALQWGHPAPPVLHPRNTLQLQGHKAWPRSFKTCAENACPLIAQGGHVRAREVSSIDQTWREPLLKGAALFWSKSLPCALGCSIILGLKK